MSRRRVAAVLGTLLVLAGCTSAPEGAGPASPATSPDTSSPAAGSAPVGSPASPGSAPPEQGRTAGAVPVPPEEGDCYRLGFEQLAEVDDDSAPVPCRRRHTTQTIYVGELDTEVDEHSGAAESRAVLDQISTTCPRRLARHLGGTRSTRALSRFHVVWFTPTLAESDAGARWFRCDVIAFAGHETLAPLPAPRRLEGVLDDLDALDTYGLCGTAAPGAPGFERVICARRHSWRAISTIRLDGGRRYPGAGAVRGAGDETCKDRVRRRSADALRFRYGWEWPTREQWRRGQRHGFCWAPD